MQKIVLLYLKLLYLGMSYANSVNHLLWIINTVFCINTNVLCYYECFDFLTKS